MLQFELKSRPSKFNENAINFMIFFENNLDLKEEINFNKIKLYKRNSLHLTLIGNVQSFELYEFLEKKYSQKEIKEIYLKIEKIILDLITNIKFELKKEFHLLKKEYEKEIRYSIIQIIETDILEKMWEEIEELTSFKISYGLPHPHITLYKQKENFGIGLNKLEDLNKYSLKKVSDLNELILNGKLN